MARTRTSRSTSASRDLEDLERVARIIPGYDPWRDAGSCRFERTAAAGALDFFSHAFVHIDGPLGGKRFSPEPWEAAIIANLFGWYRPDGTRRYRECMIYIPRKNGKTFLAACIGVQVLFCDDEPGSQIYVAASDAQQAEILHRVAKQQVLRNKHFQRRAEVWKRRIVLNGTTSFFEAINSSPNSKWGFNSHVIIIDELHALEKPEDKALIEALETSRGARRQSLLIYLTTADVARKSICNQRVEYARQVRDNEGLDPYYLPVIYEAEREEDWTDPAVWKKSNPNFGVSVPEEFFVEECRKAKLFPDRQNAFRRLYLNQQTEQSNRWISLEAWDRGATAIDVESLVGRPCFGGLDLGKSDDLSAFVLLFQAPDGFYDVLPFFWAPLEGIRKKERQAQADYGVWRDRGLIEVTPGATTNFDMIRARIVELGKKYSIREIAVDRMYAEQLIQQLSGDGFTVVPFGQGFYSMAAPCKEFERLTLEGKLRHGGHPVLRWMAGNVATDMDPAGNLKPAKNKSGDKIDGIVALIMALGRATATGPAVRSVYEDRGLLKLW